MTAISVISLIFWLLVIPAGLGLLVSRLVPDGERNLVSLMVTGYLAMWSLFELTALPFLMLGQGKQVFPALVTVFAALSSLLCLSGFVLKRGIIKTFIPRIEWKKLSTVAALLALLVLGFILVMNTRTAFFDGDEAYYTGQALAAQETGYLYYRSPYTGTWAYFDRRHAFAMLPIWEAFIGTMSGLHAAVINHTVMSFVMIPLDMGAAVLSVGIIMKKKSSAWIFAILYGVLLIFSRISIYTRGTFLLTRTPQGKAAASAFYMTVLLWLIYVSMKRLEDKKGITIVNPMMTQGQRALSPLLERADKGFPWLLLISGLSAGLFSSLSLMLTVMFVFIAFAVYSLVTRSVKPMLYALLSCVPQLLYLVLYMGAGL